MINREDFCDITNEDEFDDRFISLIMGNYWKKPDVFWEVNLYDTMDCSKCKDRENERFPFKGNIVKPGLYTEYGNIREGKFVDIVIIDHGRKKALFFERKFTARSEGILSSLFELSLIDSEKLVFDGVKYETHLFLLAYKAGGSANANSTKKEFLSFEIIQELLFEKHLDAECGFLLYDARIPGMNGLDPTVQNKIMSNRTHLLKLIE